MRSEGHRSRLLGATVIIAAVAVLASPTSSAPGSDTANGRSIFLTGKDAAAVQIVAQKATAYRSCAACHRADGSGGVHFAGGVVSADLRRSALVVHQKTPYTVALLERAISTGVDNTGAPLNAVMPHWKLSKKNLHAVADFVLTKLK